MGNQCCSSGGGSNLEPLQRYFDVPLTTLCAFEGSLIDAEVPPAELFHTEAEEGSLERGKKGHSKRLTLKAMIGAGGHWSSVTRQALNIRNSHVSATYHSVPQLVSDLCSLAVELCPKLPSARSDAVTLFISVDLRRMASSVTQPWISNLKQGIDHTFQTDRLRWKQWAQRERSQMKAVEHRRTMTSDPVMQLVRGWEPSTARVLALLAFFFRSLPSPLLPPTVVSELHSMFNATYDSTDAIRNAICLREAVCRYWREVFAVTFPIAYCVIERLAETFAVLSGVPLNASAANPHREEQWRTTLDGWLLQSGWIAEVQEDADRGHGRGHGGRHGGPSDHRVHHSELYGYIAEWVFMLQRDTPVMTTLEANNNNNTGSATMNATAPSKESETTTAGTGSGGNTRNEQVASSSEQQQQQRALESDQTTSKAASETEHTGTRGSIIAEEALTMASPLITSTSHGPTTAGATESVKRKETSTSLGNAAHDAPRGATSPEASPPEDTTTKGTATPIASANRTPHLTHVRHVDSAAAVMSDMEEDNAGRNESASKQQQRQQQQMDHHGVGVRSCSSSIAPVSEFSVVAPRLEVTERGRFSEAPDPSTSKSAAAIGDRRSTSQAAAGSSALATLRLAKQVFFSGSEELHPHPMHSNQEDDHHQERPHGDNLSASAVSESQAHQSSTGHIPLISSFGGEFDVIRNFMLEASEAMSDLNKELEAVRQQQQHVTVLVEQGMASRPFRDNVQRVIAELATTTADNGDEILKLRKQIKELEESLQHANMDRDRLAADAAAARFSAQEVLLKWADMDRLMLHHDQALKYHERKQADTQDALQQLATHYKSLQVDMDTMQRRMMMLRGSI